MIPHIAVIEIKAELHPLLNTGDISQTCVHKQEELVSVSGDSYEDCLEKLEKLIKELKRDCS